MRRFGVIKNRGDMEHIIEMPIRIVKNLNQTGFFGDVGRDEADIRIKMMFSFIGLLGVGRDDGISLIQQKIHHMRADKAASACNEHGFFVFHDFPLVKDLMTIF